MEFIYGVCYQVFSIDLLSNQSKFVIVSVNIIIELIILAQNIQFYWNPLLTKKNWSTYYDFWNTINLPSIDVLAAKFDYIPEYLAFELFLIFSIFLATSIILIMNAFKKGPPKILLIITKLIFFIICEVVFIPTCILLCVVFKYSGGGGKFVVEYPSVVDSSIVNFGLAGRIGAPLVIFIFLLLTLFYEVSNYDIRITKNVLLENKKINPNSSILIKLTYFINSYFFTTYQLINLESYLYFAIGNYSVLTIILITSVPFYSIFLNSLKVWSHLNMTLMSSLFLIGIKMNDMSITFILTVFLQPSLLYFSYYLVKYRLRFVGPMEKVKRKRFGSFELAIRQKIVTGELREKLLKYMNKNYKIYENKLNIVLQSYYCLYSLCDSSLALCKISQVNHLSFNILEDYQVFKCKKIIEKHSSETSDSYGIFKYFESFAKVKKKDKYLCKDFLALFRLFSDSSFSLSNIKSKINQIEKEIKIIKDRYFLILNQFHNTSEVREYYGSLLFHLLNDQNNGQKILCNYFKNTYIHKGTHLNRIKGKCIFVLDDLGKIVYYNKRFLELISMPIDMPKEIYLNEFLPRLTQNEFKKKLKKYHFKCYTTVAVKDSQTFLLDFEGFLIECILNIESIGDTKSCYFILKANIIENHYQESALIEKDGYINEHTKNLPKVLGIEHKNIKGRFLSEFLEDFSFSELSFNEINCKKLTNCDKIIFITLKIISLKETTVLVIYFSEKNARSKFIDKKSFFKYTKELLEEENKDEEEEKKETDYLNDKKKIFLNFTAEKKNTTTSNITSNNIDIKSASIFNENLKISRQIENSIRAFNIVKILLFISIIIIFIFALVITVMTQMEVTHSKDLSTLKTINNIIYSFSKISLLSLSLSVQKNKQIYFNLSQADLEQEVNVLLSLNNDLFKRFNDWSYCSTSDIEIKQLLYYWASEKNSSVVFVNLHEIINIITETSNSFIENNYDKNDLFKIYFSSTGFSLSKLGKVLEELVSCENQRIKHLENTIYVLLLVGVVVSLIALVAVSVFMIYIEDFIKNLWMRLSISLKNRAIHMKSIVVERLAKMHNMSYLLENNDDHDIKNFKVINSRHYPRYILRFSILYIVGIASYLAMTLHFCDSVSVLLYNKPVIMNQILTKKNEVSLLSLHTFDIQMMNLNESTTNIFTDFYPASNPTTSYTVIFNQMSKNWESLGNTNFDSDISTSLFNSLIDILNFSPAFLSFGTITAFNSLLQDSLYLKSVKEIDSTLLAFLKNCGKFSVEIDVLAKDISFQFNSSIDKRFDILVYYYVSSIVFLLLFYFFFYYRFLNKEITVTTNIIHIIELLPIYNLKIEGTKQSQSK